MNATTVVDDRSPRSGECVGGCRRNHHRRGAVKQKSCECQAGWFCSKRFKQHLRARSSCRRNRSRAKATCPTPTKPCLRSTKACPSWNATKNLNIEFSGCEKGVTPAYAHACHLQCIEWNLLERNSTSIEPSTSRLRQFATALRPCSAATPLVLPIF